MSSAPDDDTRLRAAWHALADEARDGDDDVDAERVWAAVSGTASPEERRAVIARVATEPAWAEAWRLADELWRAAREEEPQAGASVLPFSARRSSRLGVAGPWVGLAAAAALVAALGLWWRPRPVGVPTPPILRGTQGTLQTLVPDGSRLPRGACHLRWSAGPAGTRYVLRASSEDLVNTHVVSDLEHPEYTLPPSVLAAWPAGSRLLWQVEAWLPDGSLWRSATFTVHVE
jgi:hypothetical protein